MRLGSLVGVVVSIVVVVGCSSSEGSPAVSVDGQKALAALAADEAETVCSELASYASGAFSSDETKRLGCFAMAQLATIGAADLEGAKTRCRSSFDSCLAEGSAIPVAFANSCRSFGDRRGQCAKTVADYTGCMEDVVASTKASLADPCAAAREPGTKAPAPGRCSAIAEACPSLLTGGPTP